MCVCVCVWGGGGGCVRACMLARARARVCVCVCVRARVSVCVRAHVRSFVRAYAQASYVLLNLPFQTLSETVTKTDHRKVRVIRSVLLDVKETVRIIRDRQHRMATSTFTQLLSSGAGHGLMELYRQGTQLST